MKCENCGTEVEQADTGRPRRWCSEKCRKAAAEPAMPVLSETEPVTPTVDALLAELDYPPDDPRTVAALLLRRTAEAFDASDRVNVTLARELRMLLVYLSAEGRVEQGEVDEDRIAFLARRITAKGGSDVGRRRAAAAR